MITKEHLFCVGFLWKLLSKFSVSPVNQYFELIYGQWGTRRKSQFTFKGHTGL